MNALLGLDKETVGGLIALPHLSKAQHDRHCFNKLVLVCVLWVIWLIITKFVCTYLWDLTKDSSVFQDLDLIFKIKSDLNLNMKNAYLKVKSVI